ncbi:mechanosensitive ion channel family protein [Flavicella sediminum]|uniref:mechanosensitive ion channel family protein n=1 Tax=Flavicella sediminum TaxID=2585141 RepID=UPI0011217ECF|nr:mechanosensitive ion channel domain-containing protein [Flavicella sediminum]
MDAVNTFLNISIPFGTDVHISIKSILLTVLLFFIASMVLRAIRKIVTRKLSDDDSLKFINFFAYIKYFIFLIIFLVTLNNSGVEITAILTGAAALMIGVGLALQTLFQDIISGVLILVDQSLQVNDVIELEGKTGKVISVNLRTTRMLTTSNKILIIPNHLFLTNTLYNWTQNEVVVREMVKVGVAYGSDVALVRDLLLEAANSVDSVLKNPAPTVLFTEFGDSSLNFQLAVSLKDSFIARMPKSELHFKIDELFRKHNITIPFPQRDVHIYKH